MLKQIKKILGAIWTAIRKLTKILKRILKSFSKKKYVSFGENCLTDDILSRYKLKSFSSPFAAGRSNVEYLLQIHHDNFKDFVNPEFLEYSFVGKTRVVRLTKYNSLDNKYDDSCMKGFEFTHHDVISDKQKRANIERRVNRLKSLKNCSLYILYHHRYCPTTDMDLLVKNLGDIKDIYCNQCKKVYLICFTQCLVASKEERRVEKQFINGIYVYYFYTLNVWQGDNQDIFWARCDDDLIRKMIDDIKRLR